MRRTHRPFQRSLALEDLEKRVVLATDVDDTFSEATSLGTISTSPRTRNARIDPDTDVDLYRFNVAAGQTVGFDIDTPFNGPGGLGSILRLFDSSGQQIAFNNDAAGPGESEVGFDAYLRHTFATGGTFFIGVSNWVNDSYNPITGEGDTSGGQHTVGDYSLIVQGLPPDTDDTLAEADFLGRVSTSPETVSGQIDPDIDVDIYEFTVVDGQIVDFDVDTPLNGPGGLGSYLRLFNSSGQQLAFNDDAPAPGETVLGFDAYLRHEFAVGGTYFLAVSNWNNVSYNPLTGNGDSSGGEHAIGDYQLTVNTAPPDGGGGGGGGRGSGEGGGRGSGGGRSAPNPNATSAAQALGPDNVGPTVRESAARERFVRESAFAAHDRSSAFALTPVPSRSTVSAADPASSDVFFEELGLQAEADRRRSLLFGM